MVENNYRDPIPNSSIRLVHLQLLSLISGVQKVTLDEFQSLDRSIFEPVLICKEQGALTRAVEKIGVSVHYAPSLIRPISLPQDIVAGIQLFRLFKRHAPDIVHTHSSKTGILGRIAARLSGVPVVIHMVHGYAFPFTSSWLVRLTYFLMEYIAGKFVDVVVVLNESDRQIAVKKLHIPEEKVVLIPNGVEVGNFKRTTHGQRTEIRRQHLNVSDDDVLCVGMVGRLWEQKNPACLLRAALRVLKQTEKQVQFFFIGDGDLRSELEAVIADHGLQSQIHILGWRQDVPTLLSGMDIFILPSLWEGMPLAILEAMAACLPVIASDISGNRDLVSPGTDGFLFESDNDKQLAHEIMNLINSESLRKELGENARNKVMEHYQLHNRIDRMARLYLSLLAEKRPKANCLVEET